MVDIMNKFISGKDKIFLGTRKNDNSLIFMNKPSWDCEWYWSFGYLRNKNEHYHLSNYQDIGINLTDEKGNYHSFTQKRNMNMYDCLLYDYELSSGIKDNLWSFCEQASAIYTLNDAYEVFYRGGSHFTFHPLRDTIKSTDKATNLADLLETLLQKFWNDLETWSNINQSGEAL